MKARNPSLASAMTVAAWLATATPGLAHSGTEDEQAACTPDVLSLCLFEIPNEERIVACLNRKRDRLSPACRAVIDPPSKAKGRARR